MGRILKFRAWDKLDHKMIESPMAIASGDGGWVLFTSKIEDFDCRPAVYDIRGYEIMQFTGLIDKHGKEVYEGDIVKATRTDWAGGDLGEMIEEVQISHDGFLSPFYMRENSEQDWWKDILLDGFEVIGNIYENPELIKK